MTRREGLLVLMAVALMAAVVWQYGLAPNPVPMPAPAAMAEASAGPNPLARRQVGDLAHWAAHPLFAPNRSPPAVTAPPPPPPPEDLPQVPVPVPVLQGVVVTPFPGGAYLGDGLGGDSIFLRPGQSALGLTLEEVFADRATFMGPEGEVTLPLVPPQEAAPMADP